MKHEGQILEKITGSETISEAENQKEITPKDELRRFVKTDLEVAIGFLNILRANPDIIESIITILEPSYIANQNRKKDATKSN